MRTGRRSFPSRRALVVSTGIVALAGGLVAAGSFAQGRGSEEDVAESGLRPALRAKSVATSVGPDVTVINLPDLLNDGAANGYRGYSVGTTSCNVGDQPVWWCDAVQSYCDDSQHPVIAQAMYRLKNVTVPSSSTQVGRFQQIGISWLKHGFLSTNSTNSACNPSHTNCTIPSLPPGETGNALGVGCTDTYNASLNDNRPLGMRSEVNATTAVFPYPYTNVGFSQLPDQLLRVLESDVNPALNSGALYWVEGQYVTADDAAANNGLNNASYRRVTVGSSPFNLSFSGSTVREKTGLYGWQAQDAAVLIANADFVTTGSSIVERFEVARRVTSLDNGLWHYEYAIRNMNSDRAASAFTVTFPPGTTVSNADLSVINHHSGEIYTTENWQVDTSAGNSVTWFNNNASSNANVLRWGTAFTFWFDADQPPESDSNVITLFKPGTPGSVVVPFAELFKDGFESGSTIAWSGAS